MRWLLNVRLMFWYLQCRIPKGWLEQFENTETVEGNLLSIILSSKNIRVLTSTPYWII